MPILNIKSDAHLLIILILLTQFIGCNKVPAPDKKETLPANAPYIPTTETRDERIGINNFKVIGYLPTWSGEIEEIQFSKLTHINYCFLIPTKTGGIKEIENSSKLLALVSKAHVNHVKVLISIGGWNYGDDSGFESLAATATLRNNFTVCLLGLIDKYNLDGIDIDWESPDVGNSSKNYSLLMNVLSSALHSRGKLISASVSIDHGDAISPEVFNYVDYLNLMAYDGREGSNHSPYSLSVEYLSYWKKKGLTKSKAILGLPFFGRSSNEYVLYKDILSRGGDANSDMFGSIGYNGIPTIRDKTILSLKEAAGLSIWEISGDAKGNNSLLTTLDTVIKNYFK